MREREGERKATTSLGLLGHPPSLGASHTSPQVRGELVHASASWLRGTSLICHGEKRRKWETLGAGGAGMELACSQPQPRRLHCLMALMRA